MRPSTRARRVGSLAVIALAAAALFLFLELAGDVWLNEGFAWDAPLMLWLHQWHSPLLDRAFLLVTHTAGSGMVAALALGGGVLWHRGRRRRAALLVASLAGSVVINALLKALFARPRPNVFPPLTVETSFSFPSGHTMAAMAVYGLIAIWLWQGRRYRWSLATGLWVLLVGVSRIYLGVHYPSDVLASLAVGTLWLTLITLVPDRRPEPQAPPTASSSFS